MALSAWEMQQLQGIEAFLAAADPKWAKRFEASVRAWKRRPLRRLFARHRLWWSLLAVAWTAMVTTGVVLGSAPLVVAALAVAVWVPMTALIVVCLRD
jgi:Protein of unknown function (DUF3040)